MNKLLSIIVPCFNEEEVLPIFIEAITKVREELKNLPDCPCDTELLFIDDGSSDSTLEVLRSFNAADSSVRYISFSRNFGKESAIYAGLKRAGGEYAVLSVGKVEIAFPNVVCARQCKSRKHHCGFFLRIRVYVLGKRLVGGLLVGLETETVGGKMQNLRRFAGEIFERLLGGGGAVEDGGFDVVCA